MPGVREKTEELIDLIKHSNEYRSYNELRAFITHESGIRDRIDSFRRDLLTAQNDPGSDPETFARISKEYEDILENPQVAEYLSAEQAVIQMMRDIYERLGSAVALDLSFLGEVKELNI